MVGVDWLGVVLLFWGVLKLNLLDGVKFWEFFIGVVILKLNLVLLLVLFVDVKDGVFVDFVNFGGFVVCLKVGGVGCGLKLNIELVCCVEDCCLNVNDGWEVVCLNVGGVWVVGFCCLKLKEGCAGGCCLKLGLLVFCLNLVVDWEVCLNLVVVWDFVGWANLLVFLNVGVEDCLKEEEIWVAVGCLNILLVVVVDWLNVKVELGWDLVGCCLKEIDEDVGGFWLLVLNVKIDVCGFVFVVGVELNIIEVVGVFVLFVLKLNIFVVELVEVLKLNSFVDEEVVEGFWFLNVKIVGIVVVDWVWVGFCVVKFKFFVLLVVVVGCVLKLNFFGVVEVFFLEFKLVDTVIGVEGLFLKLKVLLFVFGVFELFFVLKLKLLVEFVWKLVFVLKLVLLGVVVVVVVFVGWLLKENFLVDGVVEDVVLDWFLKLNLLDVVEVEVVFVVLLKLKFLVDVFEVVLLIEVRWLFFVVLFLKLNFLIDGVFKVLLFIGVEIFEVWFLKLNFLILEDDVVVGIVVEILEFWFLKLNFLFEFWVDNIDVIEFEDLVDWVLKLNLFCLFGEEIDGFVSLFKIDGRVDDIFNVELELLDSILFMLDEIEVVFEEEDFVEDVFVFDGIVCLNWNFI